MKMLQSLYSAATFLKVTKYAHALTFFSKLYFQTHCFV